MNATDRLVKGHDSDLARAVQVLCTFLDVRGEPRFWEVMDDASELLGGLAQRHETLRALVIVHLKGQFDGVRELAHRGPSPEAIGPERAPSFVATVRALLRTSGLVGLRDWCPPDDLERFWEDVCRVVGSRRYASEKFLPDLVACYSDYARPQAIHALRALARDEQVLLGIHTNAAAEGQLAAAALTQGLSLPHLSTDHWSYRRTQQLSIRSFARRRAPAARRDPGHPGSEGALGPATRR